LLVRREMMRLKRGAFRANSPKGWAAVGLLV